MLKEGNVVTLKNKYKYDVLFSTIYNNDNYILLSNQNNFFDSSFYKYNNLKNLEFVKDINIIQILIKKFEKKCNNK